MRFHNVSIVQLLDTQMVEPLLEFYTHLQFLCPSSHVTSFFVGPGSFLHGPNQPAAFLYYTLSVMIEKVRNYPRYLLHGQH